MHYRGLHRVVFCETLSIYYIYVCVCVFAYTWHTNGDQYHYVGTQRPLRNKSKHSAVFTRV